MNLTLEEQVDLLHEAVHQFREVYTPLQMAALGFTVHRDSPIYRHGITEICGVPIYLDPEDELDSVFDEVDAQRE